MADRPAVSVLHLHGLDRSGEDEGQFRHRIAHSVDLLDAEPDFAPTHRHRLDPDAPRLALAAGILVVHGLAAEEIEGLIRERRAVGRITLFEIGDELSSARPWSRRNPAPPGPVAVARVLLHASLCDGVQFSAPWLCRRYADVHPRRAVLDNLVRFPATAAAKPEGFRLGWAGTRSHRDDVAAIAPAILTVCRRHPDVRFAAMCDPELWPLFAELGDRFEGHPFGRYADYRAFLASLHVGLVPLADTVFNRGRSDVKPVEMAAEGAVVLAQDVPAYHHLADAVELFADAADLEVRLGRIHAGRDGLAARARTMRAVVGRRRGEAAVRARHLAWFHAWPAPAGGALPPPPDPEPAQALADALRSARHGDGEGALEAARRLLAHHPDHVQARWLAARMLRKLGRGEEAMALGAPLADCPVFRNVWWPFAASVTGDRGLLRRTRIPLLRIPPRTAAEGEGATARYHRDMLEAHPFHPFALAVEQRRLEREGDTAGAARLGRRRRLLDASLGGGCGT